MEAVLAVALPQRSLEVGLQACAGLELSKLDRFVQGRASGNHRQDEICDDVILHLASDPWQTRESNSETRVPISPS
jgi:hypothetical protein